MPKVGCIKNQFIQGGNGLDFVEEIGGGICELQVCEGAKIANPNNALLKRTPLKFTIHLYSVSFPVQRFSQPPIQRLKAVFGSTRISRCFLDLLLSISLSLLGFCNCGVHFFHVLPWGNGMDLPVGAPVKLLSPNVDTAMDAMLDT
ncbi:MAG: hypothetical protein OIF50_09250, partial [Flavobacteriaceae bacterium]|nr:hypothetical protein [Flavobacteriaceae bacterium]